MSVVIGKYKEKLYQWDTGQYLRLDGEYDEVHFCQEGSKTLICKPREKDGHRGVDVPNILLQKPGTITVYKVSRNEEGMETTWARSFRVQARPKPENYVYTQTEVLNFASLENRLANLEGEGLKTAVADYLKDNPITGGTVTDEQIASAVEKYLDENQIDTGVNFETDKTLTLKDGILSVKTTDQMEQDNTLPITSAGVFATVGNIEALLKTI